MSNPWHPGGFARLPWTALAALLGAIGGIAGSIAVLIVSDGTPIANWSFQPTVYLSIISTMTNILVVYAFSEGKSTAWWLRALKTDTKILDLHYYWKTGTSLLSALKSGRNFNVVALASIMVAISSINGPLLQRAPRVAVLEEPTDVRLSMALAPEILSGFTGIIEGQNNIPAWFSEAFTPVVNGFYNRIDATINNTGCIGTCSATVVGAGFAVDCTTYETLFNATVYAPPNTSLTTDQPIWSGITAFETAFNWYAEEGGTLYLTVEYKPNSGCVSTLIARNCTLNTATVQYSTIINGNQSIISLAPNKTIYDDAIQSHYNVTDFLDTGEPSTLGGFYLALNDQFTSYANVAFGGGIGYTVTSSGILPNQFVIPSGDYTSCNISFSDPTDTLMSNIRELMFRTAIAAGNSSNLQSVPAVQLSPLAVYQSHYLYLALASGFTLLAIIFVIPTFFGYWQLGRDVSMNPIEIAKAFSAPILRGVDSNAKAEQLIERLGELQARYGVISTGNGIDGLNGPQQTLLHKDAGVSGKRLEIALSKFVTRPEKGWEFTG